MARLSLFVVAAVLVGFTAMPSGAQFPGTGAFFPGVGEKPGVEAQADTLLKQMSAYLTGLQQFSFHAHSAFDVVLKTGQKVQLCTEGDVYLKRPNRLKVDRKGEFSDVALYYDGKTLTMYGKRQNLYASAPAPGTLDGTLDEARDRFGLSTPAADLLYSNVYDGLIAQASRGFIVGRTDIGDVVCTHLAFRGDSVDWQVWIQEGDTPLPMRYVLTGPASEGSPQFEVTLSNWNVSPKLADAEFEFAKPEAAQRIEFLDPEHLPKTDGGK